MDKTKDQEKTAAQIFVKNLNALMAKYHVPRTALAEASGYNVVSVSRYLNEKTTKIPLDFAAKAAEFFDLTITDFLETKKINFLKKC